MTSDDSVIKSGLEIVSEFVDSLSDGDSIDSQTLASIRELHKSGKLTRTRLLQSLRDLREAFYFYDTNSKIVASFQTQILSLGAIFDRFVQVQSTSLQTVLDKISDDIGRFYQMLHPSENVDKVRLRIVGEEGIEFEYYFHGKPTYPPLKYLSESHLNSLGVVLFLASAKLFNRKSKFLVLDDIVTSFDVNHRRRLLRLIKEVFRDWQVILLTHEAFWFDIIKKELVPDGWLVKEVICDAENGIQIEPSANDLIALIAAKRQKFDVSNDLRKLLEATLKEICKCPRGQDGLSLQRPKRAPDEWRIDERAEGNDQQEMCRAERPRNIFTSGGFKFDCDVRLP